MTNALLAPTASRSTSPTGSCLESVRRVVLIDPRPERRAITSLVVERCGALTVVGLAESLGEAESQILAARADVALVEIQMPVALGLKTVAALRNRFRDLQIVVCSFRNDEATREAARTHGADGYLNKPFQAADLLPLVVSLARSASCAD